MSSPFSKMFTAKNPISQTAAQKAKLPKEVVNAIAKQQGNPPVEMKTPAYAHGEEFKKKAKKLSEGVESGDYDYENKEVVKLLDKAKQAEKDHAKEVEPAKNKSSVKDFNLQKEGGKPMKKNNAAPEMSAIKKKTAPLNASYANPQDYFYVSNADDFQKLFDNISSNTAKVIEAQNDPETQADRLQKRIDKRNASQVKKEQGSYDATTGDYAANDPASKFDKKTAELIQRQKENATRASNQATDPCKNKTKGTQTYDSYGNIITC